MTAGETILFHFPDGQKNPDVCKTDKKCVKTTKKLDCAVDVNLVIFK